MFHNEVAEQSVLGGLLIDNYRLADVMEVINHNDFHFGNHRLIFEAMEVLTDAGDPVDVTTVMSKLGDNLEKVGGMAYLAELAQSTPSTANVLAYAKTIKARARERDVWEIAQRMQGILMSDDEDKVNSALSLFNTVEDDHKEMSVRETLKKMVEDLEYRSKNPGVIHGVSTGFAPIDNRTNGLNPTDLIILAARPAMGKTTLALNIAKNILKLDKNVMIFSMEMSQQQLLDKIVSSTGIPLGNIKTGQLTDDNYYRYNRAIRELNAASLVIDDRPALTIQQVRHKCIRLHRKKKLDLIVIDYLQLMTANGKNSREQEISTISRGLKQLAKELNCPVIALSQLNRSLEQRQNKRPIMSDLRESGAIEQDADIIMALFRDEVYDETMNPGIAELIFLKHRHGEIGTDKLRSELHLSRFV